MKLKISFLLISILFAGFTMNSVVFAQSKKTTKKSVKVAKKKNTTKKASDEVRRAKSSADVFQTIMKARDNRIPKSVLDKANCIAVFPNVLKAAFVIGGRYGKGMISCRQGNGWSAPSYMKMTGGSVGFQIGGQSTDFVLLFMSDDGIDSLLANKFTLGTELSIAAGPVGRSAGASTDVALNAQILSYSRTKGLFAGLSLKGVSIAPDEKAIENIYGKDKKTETLIKQTSRSAPNSVEIYPNTLRKYAK